ncbi:MAG: nodulation protein NfeD [Myxococcales bacterium]|nr:nodulation protein NfeD [Myxococcales bacterium]
MARPARSTLAQALALPGLLLCLGGLGVAFAAPDAGPAAPASAAGSDAKAGDARPGDAASDAPRAFTKTPAKPLPKLSDGEGAGQRVLVVPIKGTIEPGLVPFVRRSLRENPGVAAVIFEVDTFGGRVDAATEIRDAVLGVKVPTVAFIHRRAISAGALISLAADYLVFSNGASMGAATPIQMSGGEAKPVGEKMVSYMRAEMRATAEAKGRNGDLAEAMVDADVAVEGVIPKGKLLTVTTDLAEELGLANARHESRRELLAALGLADAEVAAPTENWAEGLARFLTSPAVSGVLMLIGMLGLYMELSTPGVGLPGLVGVLALGAFFGGHMVVALAGWEEVALFLLALALLAAEVFVIPGFGIAGVAGLALLGVSLVMAMMDLPLSVAWDGGVVASALTTVILALVGSVALFFVVLKYLPDTRLASGLMLKTTLGNPVELGGEGYTSAPEDWTGYLGQRGVASTPLRPSGKAVIDGTLVDVVSQMDWIDKGTPVRVIEVEGVRIVVVRDDAKGVEEA